MDGLVYIADFQRTQISSGRCVLFTNCLYWGAWENWNHINSLTYPIFIFDVDISSFLNKTFHSVSFTFYNCNVQGSFLFERMEQINYLQ